MRPTLAAAEYGYSGYIILTLLYDHALSCILDYTA
jgi:hypothetical protein